MPDEKKEPGTYPQVGPLPVWVSMATAGKYSDGSVALNLYSPVAISDGKSGTLVVAFTAVLSPAAAQSLLTNLDGALMAAPSSPPSKE